MVLEALLGGPPMERRREFAAANLKAESYLEREHTRDGLRLYYEMKLLSGTPPKRSAEDILFDYLDAEERRIYNDLARRIQKRFEELESEKSRRRDRRGVTPSADLMPE